MSRVYKRHTATFAICTDCGMERQSRTAEKWAIEHAKQNPLHRVGFGKTWVMVAPYVFKGTIKKG